MDFDLSRFGGKCRCGREHHVLTKLVLVESGATAKLEEVIGSLNLPKRGVLICDSNTQAFARLAAGYISPRLHPLKPYVVLNPEGLHADEQAVARVESQLPVDTGWLMAVGSGTIHDATRYVANSRGINFISYPTAASVDGFVSTVCAMTWHGFKKTLPGIAPIAVVADTDIFANAPHRLNASGAGDVLGKYIALADWRISHILTGEEICPEIAATMVEAVDNVRAGLEGVRSSNPAACERLMYAQLLSGIGMQMWGDSRPASGSEHHLSHFWEMELLNPRLDALHGEKVGIGLHVALAIYRRAADEDLFARRKSYGGMDTGRLRAVYGGLYGEIEAENTPDPLLDIGEATEEKLAEVREVLRSLPDGEALRAEMRRAACLTDTCQIGLDEGQVAESVAMAPYVRRRLTFMRMMRLFDL